MVLHCMVLQFNKLYCDKHNKKMSNTTNLYVINKQYTVLNDFRSQCTLAKLTFLRLFYHVSNRK